MSCPFGDDFPGWRIQVEAFYTPDPGRTYGQGTYGSDVYGDLNAVGPSWQDITTPAFSLSVTIGGADATPIVSVNEYTLELHDDTGDWWDFPAPARYNLPAVGTPIRFGLIDPAAGYWPIGAGVVESITDEHQTLPRVVTVTAYGTLTALVSSIINHQRPAEPSSSRIAAILAFIGSRHVYSVPPVPAPTLTADAAPRTINVRDELDRCAISSGWFLHEDGAGVLRFAPWPHVATGATLTVTDCVENPGELLAPVITFVADTGALLNCAQLTNDQSPPVAVEAVDIWSTAKYGRRTEGVGFPITGLAFASFEAGATIANQAVARYCQIVSRVESFEVDSSADRTWLEVLAGLGVGRPVHVVRHGVRAHHLDTIVVGFEMQLVPNRITATIYVTTLTPTL